MEKFNDKYRIQSARLKYYDYSSEGLYFVTINTENHNSYFGKIENGEMKLNELGLVAFAEWEKIITVRPDMNLSLGEFVIMPDHMHGIIGIGENKYNENNPYTTNRFGPQKKNLSSIMRGYKSTVTSYAKNNNMLFGWQERFHDHIIRSYDEFRRISMYIKNNPKNWKQK